MAGQFIGEIRLMAFNFPPKDWAFCNGQLLPINQNQALFSLLGTTYGGDGRVTFALPNLRGRVPIHFGNAHSLGEAAGSESVTITQQTMPQHVHSVLASTAATGGSANPTNKFLGGGNNVYRGGNPTTTLNPAAVANAGGSQPHENRAPFLVLNFCIALIGDFPSRN
jgi:microcystin-dependent protein